MAACQLGAHIVTAVTADQLAGKDARTAVGTAQALTACDFYLHSVEVHRRDNCQMAAFHIILWKAAIVDLLLFGEEVYRELFLVEIRGFEPLTFCMRSRRAPNCAIPPNGKS